MKNRHSTKMILFSAGWFEMGILGRKESKKQNTGILKCLGSPQNLTLSLIMWHIQKYMHIKWTPILLAFKQSTGCVSKIYTFGLLYTVGQKCKFCLRTLYNKQGINHICHSSIILCLCAIARNLKRRKKLPMTRNG